MPVSQDAARANFAAFISRVLESARRRGMTDKDIHLATGIGPSTFHRWSRGEFRTAPNLDRVRLFCAGLGASLDEAARALSMSDVRAPTAPAPMPQEVSDLLQRLADPNVPDEEKQFLLESVRRLVPPRRRSARRTG